MTAAPRSTHVRRYQRRRGQSIVEYLIICAALTAALTLPVHNGDSVMVWLVDVMHQWWANFTYMLSLP